MSRSDTMPSIRLPSWETGTAPMRCSLSKVTSSATDAPGSMVTTPPAALASSSEDTGAPRCPARPWPVARSTIRAGAVNPAGEDEWENPHRE